MRKSTGSPAKRRHDLGWSYLAIEEVTSQDVAKQWRCAHTFRLGEAMEREYSTHGESIW